MNALLRQVRPASLIRGGVTLVGLGLAIYLTLGQAREQGVSVDLGVEPLIAAAGFLIVSALLAGLRLKAIASRYGYQLSMSSALRANAAGAALAQVMITFVGYTTGRAMVLRKTGVRHADTIEFGILERLAALTSLGAAAIAAAVYLFGDITLGAETAWIVAVYYVLGLGTSLAAASWIWRDKITELVGNGNADAFRRALFVAIFWSVLVHATMAGAYAAMLASFDHGLQSFDVVSASILIMFAAAIPISFSG